MFLCRTIQKTRKQDKYIEGIRNVMNQSSEGITDTTAFEKIKRLSATKQ